jgi:hypothetical protein
MGGSGSPTPSTVRAGDGAPTLADLARSGIGESGLPGSALAATGLPASDLAASDLPASGRLPSNFGSSDFFNSDWRAPFRKPNVDGVGMVAFAAGADAGGAGGRNADRVDPSVGCGGNPAAMRGRAVAA